jgi:hypothetical protein
MTNPTSNYGFVLPTATDLVTDLPADFDVALQGVDTRLKALQPGTTLGDLAYSSATANTNTRLGVGTNGQVLAVSGGVPAWTTTSDVTPLTTKGDLFTFTTVDARLGVGTNGQALVADSAEATGLKWATPSVAAKSYSLLNSGGTALTGAASITVSGISGKDDLMIIVKAASSANATGNMSIEINGDSSSIYNYSGPQIYAPSAYSADSFTSESSFGSAAFPIGKWGSSATQKVNSGMSITGCNSSGIKIVQVMGGADNFPGHSATSVWHMGSYEGTATVSSIKILSSNGNFDGGTIYIYGAA